MLSQTRPPSEIWVIDDGSTDESAAIAEGLAGPIRVVRQRNRGESVARNVGLRNATTDYVLFLDADDMIAPESLERMLRAVANKPGAVAVMGLVIFTDDPGAPLGHSMPAFGGFWPAVLQSNFGPPHCLLVPRELALRLGGFREDLANSEDWEFLGRLALSNASLVEVPYEGALYRRHPNSQVATTPKPAILLGRLFVCETLATGLLERPDLLAEYEIGRAHV